MQYTPPRLIKCKPSIFIGQEARNGNYRGADVRTTRVHISVKHRCYSPSPVFGWMQHPQDTARHCAPSILPPSGGLGKYIIAPKSPGSAHRAFFSSRNRSYLLTAILACRSVG